MLASQIAQTSLLHPMMDEDTSTETLETRVPSEFPDARESCAEHFAALFDSTRAVVDVHGRMERIEASDGTLDAVTCFDELSRATEPRKLLLEIRRALKRNGSLAISLSRTYVGKDQAPDVVRELCLEDLDGMLIRAGFAPEQWVAEDETLYVIARRDDAWGHSIAAAATAVYADNPRVAILEIMGTDAAMMPPAVQRELALLACEALCLQGKLDEALEFADTANEVDKLSARVTVALGSIALLIGDLSAAVEAFEEGTRRAPDCYTAWLGLALSCEAADLLGDAVHAIEAAQSMAQGDKRVVDAFARLARKAGDEAVAQQAEEIGRRLA